MPLDISRLYRSALPCRAGPAAPVPGFDDWLETTTAGLRIPKTAPRAGSHWSAPHHQLLKAALAALTTGACDRLMLFLPPRHGKSELVTIRYVAWRILRDPGLRVILAAYNAALAARFSRRCRRLVAGHLPLSAERAAVSEWETPQGGGLRAVGVGGGVTGLGAGLIIIDDPVKSREEAGSESRRDRVWDWYRDDILTRQEPGCALILIQTRWHEDDLAGRILTGPDGHEWVAIRLPARAETQEERDDWALQHRRPCGLPDPIGREPGDALWPERFDEAALLRRERALGRRYYALYQQYPRPLAGDFFRRGDFRFVDRRAKNAYRVRYWDRAASHNRGDYTVGVLMARSHDDENFTIEDIVRGRWAPADRDSQILRAAQADRLRHARDGSTIQICMEQEPGSAGIDAIRAAENLLRNFRVIGCRVTGDRLTRTEPLAAAVAANRVNLLQAPWNDPFLAECVSFPHARHDDQVDAAAGAYNRLTSIRWARVI